MHRLPLAIVLVVAGCTTAPAATDAGSGVDARAMGDASGIDAARSDAPGVDAWSAIDGAGADAFGAPVDAGGLPSGWLYTRGNHLFVSNGAGGGTQWMGRGVNLDDIFLCGYNTGLWMSATQSSTALETMVSGLVTSWHPTFVRVSLGMASYPPSTSWMDMPARYRDPMTQVINMIGAHAGVYVLVALRSHDSMIRQDTVHGDPEATGIPSDSATTPDRTRFPTGTDATYVALVDTFAHSPFVLFGITNEPGGNLQPDDVIRSAMEHAVSVIRAEEDRLGVPHHIISVQGNGWTSDIRLYGTTPVATDNVVYEVHGYPPTAASYTYANIPVIIGEYGSLPDAAAFFADVERKQIPNLAWDFEAYSDCTPDLLNVTHDATMLTPNAWGNTVRAYLTSH